MTTFTVVAEARLSNGDAAKELGITTASLARWIRQGRLRPTLITPGGQARWDMDDLRAQLDDMRRRVEEERQLKEAERIRQARANRQGEER